MFTGGISFKAKYTFWLSPNGFSALCRLSQSHVLIEFVTEYLHIPTFASDALATRDRIGLISANELALAVRS